MHRVKGKAPRNKRAKSMPPVLRSTSNKSRRRGASTNQKRHSTSTKKQSNSFRSSVTSRSSSIAVPAELPPALTALTNIPKPTNKMIVVGQSILANLQDLRGIVWQRLCSMIVSGDGKQESQQSDSKLSFIDSYIKVTSSLEANLNEMNRDYLKQLLQRRRTEDDNMFLEITQELFRLQRLLTTAFSSGRVSVSAGGRAKDPKVPLKSGSATKMYRVNSNPLAEVAVRDMDALGRLLDNFFHGESDVIDTVPDHCFWMRRNILMRCSAREEINRKQRPSMSSEERVQ